VRDVLPQVKVWVDQGRQIALATVVRTWGSSPRIPGSKMAVTSAGEMVGSVSAGCVEGAVVEEAQKVLASGRPALLHYGVADDTALEVGLACGGEIDIFVEPLAPLLTPSRAGEPVAFDVIARSMERGTPAVRLTVIRGPEGWAGRTLILRQDGSVIGSAAGELREALLIEARAALATSLSAPKIVRVAGQEVEVFVEAQLAPPTLAIIGAVHIAIELSQLAKVLGYRVVIIDPRRAFGTRDRFPQADVISNLWPDKALAEEGLTPATAVAVLSHDPKIDDPALIYALHSPAFYVGALGSQRTQRLRRERLLANGVPEADLARMRAPIGINLGGRAPAEIALSIMAEIVAVRSGNLTSLKSS
jgi:xanthine dehydrogenase accessory factor